MENQTAQHPETSLDRQETDVGDVVTCHSLDHPNTASLWLAMENGGFPWDIYGVLMGFNGIYDGYPLVN